MNFKVLVTVSALSVAALAGAAGAATVNAISVTVGATTTTTATNTTTRSDAGNALGASNAYAIGQNTFGGFYSLRFGQAVFAFGTNFGGPGTVVEVTAGSRSNYPEAAKVEAFNVFSSMWDDLGVISNAGPTGLALGVPVTFGGVYSLLRLTDATTGDGDGFDVDSVSVSAVPVPAAGFLLIGALGSLAALKRRRAKA